MYAASLPKNCDDVYVHVEVGIIKVNAYGYEWQLKRINWLVSRECFDAQVS